MPEDLIPFKKPMALLVAIFLSLPVVTIIWGVVVYMVYGVTGEAIHPFFHIVTSSVLYLIIFGWALFGSSDISEIVYRLCRFGAMLSLLIPVITAFTSILWSLNVAVRPDGFLPSYSALEIPVYSVGVAMLLIALFFIGSYLAARNIEGVPF